MMIKNFTTSNMYIIIWQKDMDYIYSSPPALMSASAKIHGLNLKQTMFLVYDEKFLQSTLPETQCLKKGKI